MGENEKAKEANGVNGFPPNFDSTSASESDEERSKISVKEKRGEITAVRKPPSKVVIVSLALLFIATGSINTLSSKWADEVKVHGRKFSHPFFQAAVMFVGEMACMGAFFVTLLVQRYQWRKRHATAVAPVEKEDVEAAEKGSQKSDTSEIPTPPRFNYFLFAIPAICDIIATSIGYLGLSMTSASSFQMLRGASIIFTGLLSMIFLRARLPLFRWTGMILVVIGLAVVGIADIVFHKEDSSHSTRDIFVGDLLVVLSQVFSAIQVVIEQKLLSKCSIPALFAVGLEGIAGLIILSIAMIPMYYIHVGSTFSKLEEYRLEDAIDAFHMLRDSGMLDGALCTTIVSMAFFNFAGMSVTKLMSGTTKKVLDSIRTIIIWIVSCLVPYFKGYFIPLQILGFVLLIIGMFIYNDILIMPFIRQTKLYARVFPNSEEAQRLEREKAEKK